MTAGINYESVGKLVAEFGPPDAYLSYLF